MESNNKIRVVTAKKTQEQIDSEFIERKKQDNYRKTKVALLVTFITIVFAAIAVMKFVL